MINNVINVMADEISAVDQVLEVITKIFNTELCVVGGTTLTVGLLVVALLKFFIPKDKEVARLETIINNQEEIIETLEKENDDKEARIQTLEARQNVIIENTPNKRVRDCKDIVITSDQIKKTQLNATRLVKKIRVKVKNKKGDAVNGN